MALLHLSPQPDLVDRAYRALVDAISDGTLAPGQRLTQEDLAARLAVSRQPVLQALRLLKKDGFVQDAAGRGLQVAPLDAAWIRQVYEVRGALDALAARQAAERGARLDPALIAHGRACAAGTDIRAMLEADLAFHQAIYSASGNPLIAQSADLHWRHLRRVMGAVLQTTQRHTVWDEHEAIARAIADGRGEDAAALATRHAQEASVELVRRMTQVLARTSPGEAT